jgi:hypothetical protein
VPLCLQLARENRGSGSLCTRTCNRPLVRCCNEDGASEGAISAYVHGQTHGYARVGLFPILEPESKVIPAMNRLHARSKGDITEIPPHHIRFVD